MKVKFDWKDVIDWDISPIIKKQEDGKIYSNEWKVTYRAEFDGVICELCNVIKSKLKITPREQIEEGSDYILPSEIRDKNWFKKELLRVGEEIGDLELSKYKGDEE